MALRARLWFTPLTPDEAGAQVVAQGWADGRDLYTELFIDRPQGFVFLYQGWGELAGTSPTSVRVLAALAGAIVVVAAALAARAIGRSNSAGAAAAVLVAVFASSPAIEGHTANAELLAAAAATAAVAAAGPFIAGWGASGRLIAAGSAGALAMAIKQSAFDVVAALAVWLVLAAWLRWRPRRGLVVAGVLLVAGAAAVAAVVVAHGASLGWDAYRYAMVDLRWNARSTVSGARWSRLVLTSGIVAALAGVAVWLAARHLRSMRRPWRWTMSPPVAFVAIWLAFGTAGLLVGGNYHRHYWIQVVPAFSVALALAFTAGGARRERPLPRAVVARLVGATALPLVLTAAIWIAPQLEQADSVDADEAVAGWYLDHRDDRGDSLLVLCAGATTYAAAGVDPPYPYLWVDHVRSARDGASRLRRLLAGDDRPELVAIADRPPGCDGSGAVATALGRFYEPVATIDDVTIWTRGPA